MCMNLSAAKWNTIIANFQFGTVDFMGDTVCQLQGLIRATHLTEFYDIQAV